MGAKTDMTLFLASIMHFCTLAINWLAVDTGRPPPDKQYIPLVCCGPTGLFKITPYTPPLYCGTHTSP